MVRAHFYPIHLWFLYISEDWFYGQTPLAMKCGCKLTAEVTPIIIKRKIMWLLMQVRCRFFIPKQYERKTKYPVQFFSIIRTAKRQSGQTGFFK